MSNRDNLSVLHEEDLGKFVVYGDLNCPFCFALHERFNSWDLLSRVEWRLIVHAPELSEAAFSLEDESLLANEVFAIHHRAPDVEVSLPKRRPGSSLATRLVMAISQYASDKAPELRLALYRALWQNGLDLANWMCWKPAYAKRDWGSSLISIRKLKRATVIPWSVGSSGNCWARNPKN